MMTITDQTQLRGQDQVDFENRALLMDVRLTGEAGALIAAKQNQGPAKSLHLHGNTEDSPHQGDTDQPAARSQEVEPVSSDGTSATSQKSAEIVAPTLVEALQPWEAPVCGQHVADEMAALLAKHCVLSNAEIDAIVLWTLSSHMINSFRIFPKLSLISPEKRCGKSTTLEVIKSMSQSGLMTSSLTSAVIFRLLDKQQVTLLVDEADTFIKGGDPALIGLINSGHTREGAKVLRCVGDNLEPKAFNTWAPMVLASIGDLAGTVMDRSVIIKLKRKKASETVSRIPADLFALQEDLRRQILRWAKDHAEATKNLQIEPKSRGNDRAVDNWVPLFSVAGQISLDWQQRCETAYNSLTVATEPELPTELLRDIKDLWESTSDSRMDSQTIVDKLLRLPDAAWHTCHHGKSLSPRAMAAMLAPYGIRPKAIRFGDSVKRGYEHTQFTDAFERYLS